MQERVNEGCHRNDPMDPSAIPVLSNLFQTDPFDGQNSCVSARFEGGVAIE
jgi:hypothetical protein